MKFKDITKKFNEIHENSDLTKKSITKLESSKLKSELSERFLKLETSIVATQNLISSMPQPVSITTYVFSIVIALIAGILVTAFGFASIGLFPVVGMSDIPAAEYDPFMHRIHTGDVAGTTTEYSNYFNQTYIGFVTDVNMTNRSETALITLKNRDEEITLSEHWIELIDEEWFEYNYGVDFDQYPYHFPDYNGTYQLTNDWIEPMSKDWNIIHTVDGKIKLEYYKVDNTDKLYYYNSTYPGGAEVEYTNGEFIIICSQEEIEYERIL